VRKIQSGFTLIELMIVVAIIGILAAIAIPQYQNYVARAQMSEALSLASGGKVALAEYFNSKGEFPDGNTAAGMEDDTSITGRYVTSVTVSRVKAADAVTTGDSLSDAVGAQGILKVHMDQDDTHSLLKGGDMELKGTSSGGSIIWVCSSPSTGEGTPSLTNFLPSSCK
jgi:type IV pilus assembly protein PilA